MLEINRGINADGILLGADAPILDFSGSNGILLPLGDNQAMELINSTERLTTAFVGGIEISGAVMLGKIHISEHLDLNEQKSWKVVLGEGRIVCFYG